MFLKHFIEEMGWDGGNRRDRGDRDGIEKDQ